MPTSDRERQKTSVAAHWRLDEPHGTTKHLSIGMELCLVRHGNQPVESVEMGPPRWSQESSNGFRRRCGLQGYSPL